MSTAQIQISITGDAIGYLGKLSDPAQVMPALARTLDRQNQLTLTHIVRDYLSFPKDGPTVATGLRTISGRLRASARATKTVISGINLTSSLGSNVFYAAIHEFGADIPSRATRSQNPGYARKHPQTKPFSLPAREMFQRGIRDRLDNYSQALGATITKLN